jgi:hypothetical protein
MAEKLQILKGREVELKIGQSFLSKNSSAAFHTMKCETSEFSAKFLDLLTIIVNI